MMPSQHRRFKFTRGFTLIEVMVVVAIIGILAAIALPSYADYIRKSRRADGISKILDLQIAQEKWRANHIIYGTLAELEGTTDPVLSSEKNYLLAITDISATGYKISAAPETDDQKKDICNNFVLTVTGGVATKTVSGTDNRCWQR